MREAITIVWQLAFLAELVLAVRLLQQSLVGLYPALMTASCVFAVQSAILISSASYSRLMMREVWKVTVPLDWLLSAWVVLELLSKWARSYPGIGRFGRVLFAVLILVALVTSLACWPFEWKALVFDHDFRIYYILNRVLLAMLALFIALVWLFFRNYPAPVAPNVIRHTHITVIYFATSALSQLAFTLNGLKVAAIVNLSIVVVTAGCFSAWAVMLTRKGEGRDAIPVMAPEEIARIERINRELLGLMKSFGSEIGAGKLS